MIPTNPEMDNILGILADLYPDAECALHHRNAFELLVATVLSAQCTDKRVNEVTPRLFSELQTPQDFADASTAAVENLICECGLYRTKAHHIIESSKLLVSKYHGVVPDTLDALLTLPGVGRKTANVMLSVAFGVPAIAVDTHVLRVSNRLGLAHSDNVLETERQLMACIPRNLWSSTHHWLIFHGRQVCSARSPKCSVCALATYCEYP